MKKFNTPVKNTWFNKVFKYSQYRETAENVEKAKDILKLIPRYEQKINDALCFDLLLRLHRGMWNNGIQQECNAPCPYGVFRTDDISTMFLSEVYLGGVWGLVTRPASWWLREHKDTLYGCNGFGLPEDRYIVDMLLNQWKKLLNAALTQTHNDMKEFLIESENKGWS
jgi:hypothetical protein